MYFLFYDDGIDYYAAQLARQQQQEREHAAQIEAARRQQAAQRAQQQQYQEQQEQQQQIIQVQQTAQPVGIRVSFHFSSMIISYKQTFVLLGSDGQIYWSIKDSNV